MTVLNTPDSPKALRETLCVAQAAIIGAARAEFMSLSGRG